MTNTKNHHSNDKKHDKDEDHKTNKSHNDNKGHHNDLSEAAHKMKTASSHEERSKAASALGKAGGEGKSSHEDSDGRKKHHDNQEKDK